MPPDRINFTDFDKLFRPGVGKENNISGLLCPHFDLELSPEPDFLFYSVFGQQHAHPRFNHCIKIWCSGENFRPDFTQCDYALSSDYLNDEPRHLRLPFYAWYLYYNGTGQKLVKGPPSYDVDSILKSKTRFCNFIYSNPLAKTRIDFFRRLSKYKQVDSGGRVLNNMGQCPSSKLDFIAPYKFTMAFENSSWPGYVTEKLVEPMLVNSLPIYWGNPVVGRDFNPLSFVNCHDYPTLDDAVERVIQLDRDDYAYVNMLHQPWFINNVENEWCQRDYMVPFFRRVFANKPHSRPKWAGVPPLNFFWRPRVAYS